MRQGYLLIGFAVPGSEDVTTTQTGCSTIGSLSAIVGPLDVRVIGSSGGHMLVNLPVPQDAGLQGIHVLLQWVVIDGTSLVLSDVFGTLIFPSAAAAAAAGGPPAGPMQPGSSGASHAMQCVRTWCNSRPEMEWNEAKREIRKALKRL
jgi:hypothetical protein